MTRLSRASLDGLPSEVARPRYDLDAVSVGVVHLGLGAFHRAHQAVVFDDALAAGDLRWGVFGASLRSPVVRDQLAPQDGLFSLVVREGETETVRVIGALRDVMVGPEDPAALVEAMAAPTVHIVSLTVTEKGYHLDPATGVLRLDDPEIAADIKDVGRPRTAPGYLLAALDLRRRRGLTPFTVLSCDNIPDNGPRLRAAVLTMAGRLDPALHDWIETQGAFPATMVDRIVPATTEMDRAASERTLGVRDQGLVRTEPFSQWVIEDRFAGPRPDFARLGVQLTDDVAPWEAAKLRLLNGAHSAIAWLGGRAGFEHVHEAVAESALEGFVERLWDEAQTTLTPPAGLDIAAYRAALMARFRNPALCHRTRQIAMDSSQKLPQRLLATCEARLASGAPIPALSLAVAGWMHWQSGRTEAGEMFEVDDPLAGETRALIAGREGARLVEALLGCRAIFPEALATDPRFAAATTEAWLAIRAQGAVGAARSLS